MSRSKWKIPYIASHINLKHIPKKIWSRSSTIYNQFLGHEVLIHNGNKWIPLTITPKHIGYKFGQFAPSKIPAVYKRNKKR